MTDLPTVGVMLLTYDRIEYAARTLAAVHSNLGYDGEMRLHIADDGSSQEYRDCLWHAADNSGRWAAVTMSNAERRGYGASYNLGTQVLHTDCPILLPLEDDWELTRPLDLTPLVRVLLEDPATVRCIRLGYVGWTQDLSGRFYGRNGATYILFDRDSPERHVAAGHPRVETREYEQRVGPWNEGLDAGSTEHEWCGRVEARIGVAWPADLIPPCGGLFSHVGTIQARGDQR